MIPKSWVYGVGYGLAALLVTSFLPIWPISYHDHEIWNFNFSFWRMLHEVTGPKIGPLAVSCSVGKSVPILTASIFLAGFMLGIGINKVVRRGKRG